MIKGRHTLVEVGGMSYVELQEALIRAEASLGATQQELGQLKALCKKKGWKTND